MEPLCCLNNAESFQSPFGAAEGAQSWVCHGNFRKNSESGSKQIICNDGSAERQPIKCN